MTNPAQAAQAYLNVGRQTKLASENTQTATPEGFGGMVKNAIDGTLEKGKAMDAKAAELASGRSDIVDLVTAVAETEVAVETMVTVRDRVISAYQEILNMPV